MSSTNPLTQTPPLPKQLEEVRDEMAKSRASKRKTEMGQLTCEHDFQAGFEHCYYSLLKLAPEKLEINLEEELKKIHEIQAEFRDTYSEDDYKRDILLSRQDAYREGFAIGCRKSNNIISQLQAALSARDERIKQLEAKIYMLEFVKAVDGQAARNEDNT